jgi:Protein of unknown function (DUF2510)
MPGLHRGKNKHEDHKQRIMIDAARQEAAPARPRAFQQPAAAPAPFALRNTPEPDVFDSYAPAPWPGWHPDPAGRHESRYFDGIAWTANVVDGKIAAIDPIPDLPPRPVDPAPVAQPEQAQATEPALAPIPVPQVPPAQAPPQAEPPSLPPFRAAVVIPRASSY